MKSGRLTHANDFATFGGSFVGRQTQLEEISSHFKAIPDPTEKDGKSRILLIRGAPGQGKTRLALEYCRRSQKTYHGIFWVNAGSDMTTMQSFDRIALQLQLGPSAVKTAPGYRAALVRQALESWRERWLLVFDQYDFPEHFPDARRLIPFSAYGDVIITGRMTKKLGGVDRTIDLQPMPVGEGVQLLLQNFEENCQQHDWSKAAKRLGGLPHALSLAAVYLGKAQTSIRDPETFLASYEGSRDLLLYTMPNNFFTLTHTETSSIEEHNGVISILACWGMVFQQMLSEAGENLRSIQHLISLVAFLEPSHIGESIFRTHWETSSQPAEWMDIFTTTTQSPPLGTESPDVGVAESSTEEPVITLNQLTTGVDALRSRALLSRQRKWDDQKFSSIVRNLGYDWSLLSNVWEEGENKMTAFSLNATVRHWLQWRQPMSDSQPLIIEAKNLVLASLSSMSRLDFSDQHKQLAGHLDAFIWNEARFFQEQNWVGNQISDCSDACSIATFMNMHGRKHTGKLLLSRSAQTREATFGLHDPLAQGYMQMLAQSYVEDGQYVEAENLQTQVIMANMTVPSSRFALFEAQEGLMNIFQLQHRLKEAEEILRDIIKHRTEFLQEESTVIENLNARLSQLVRLQGRRDESEAFSKASSKAAGIDHLLEGTDSQRLARVLNEDYRNRNEVQAVASDTPRQTSTRAEEKTAVPTVTAAREKRGIQLLRLFKGSFDEEIRCQRIPTFLEDDSPYVALSYTWGDVKDRDEITVDGMKEQVQKNLKLALQYLRNLDDDQLIWVDALCIDQKNLKEKAAQVQIMGAIFAQASSVFVWLGESSDDSDDAIDFINKVANEGFSDPFVFEQKTWSFLRSFFRRKWWHRMWVVQEILLAKKTTVSCGRKRFDFQNLVKYQGLVHSEKNKLGRPFRPMLSCFTGPFGLICQDWDEFKKSLSEGGINLYHMILYTGGSQCQEAVDKIFALFSMCTLLDRKLITVDYTISAHRLVIITAKNFLIQRGKHNCLNILQSHQAEKDPMLPSWVPDYTKDSSQSDLLGAIRDPFTASANNSAWTRLAVVYQAHPDAPPMDYSQFNSTLLSFEDQGSFETLVLTGLNVDTILTVSPAPYVEFYEDSDFQEDQDRKTQRRERLKEAVRGWENQIREFPADKDPYKETCGRYEAFWRTLIADRRIGNSGRPSEAEEFPARFEAWMGRGSGGAAPDEEFTFPFNHEAVNRCMARAFVITQKGYVGLARPQAQPGDIVCVLKGGNVPFVLRPRHDGYYWFAGDIYLHGIMDGEFVRQAKREDVRRFRIR